MIASLPEEPEEWMVTFTAKKKVKQFGKLFGVPILFYKQFELEQTV